MEDTYGEANHLGGSSTAGFLRRVIYSRSSMVDHPQRVTHGGSSTTDHAWWRPLSMKVMKER